jgi:peroxiredoxin
MAVLVDEEGRIGSELAVGAEQVLTLLGAPPADGKAPATATPRVGDTAPAIELTDLGGRTVKLSDFRGSETLVLFWNPGCGFCQQMLDDLKTWDASPPPGAPRLLVVSTGSVEENRALGLRSPVVLDQGFSVGSAFGANGTPMAVLIDAEGRIASDVAGGAPAVLTLARGENQAASATN